MQQKRSESTLKRRIAVIIIIFLSPALSPLFGYFRIFDGKLFLGETLSGLKVVIRSGHGIILLVAVTYMAVSNV